MVASATNLTHSGLRDWLIQRVTAVVIGLYTLFLFAYITMHPTLNFFVWHQLFMNPWMQIFSFLTLVSLVLHAWVGVWTIFTDYIKPLGIRLILNIAMVLALLSYLAWGIKIIWG